MVLCRMYLNPREPFHELTHRPLILIKLPTQLRQWGPLALILAAVDKPFAPFPVSVVNIFFDSQLTIKMCAVSEWKRTAEGLDSMCAPFFFAGFCWYTKIRCISQTEKPKFTRRNVSRKLGLLSHTFNNIMEKRKGAGWFTCDVCYLAMFNKNNLSGSI